MLRKNDNDNNNKKNLLRNLKPEINPYRHRTTTAKMCLIMLNIKT